MGRAEDGVNVNEPATKPGFEAVEAGSKEAVIIDEELSLLSRVLKDLASDEVSRVSGGGEYDAELLSLRDQISEAHVEDLAPLIAEMYRMQALGAANGRGRDLPVDVTCPYFGHLKLSDGKKTRDVLVGNRGFVKPGAQPIVDWRNAPVSRIYYCYEEGDDYEERFGGRRVGGVVSARRTLNIVKGELKRITWSTGSVARRGDGKWVHIPLDQMPTLSGGAGAATRPPSAQEAAAKFKPGSLGVVGDESLREDKHLREITALIDPVQFKMITSPDSGIVILQGGAGSGKTTVALALAAYLHYENPQVFSPKKMAVVVKSAPLTEYISRVLPSLDVGGTLVVTLEDWMQRTRKKVLPEIKRKYTGDAPASVSRLKKHPAMLDALAMGVERDAAQLIEALEQKVGPEAAKAVRRRWDNLANLALLPRIREMGRWSDSPRAERAGLTKSEINGLQGVLRRARSNHDDVLSAWADFLTDAGLLREAFAARGDNGASDDEINELVRWVSLQMEEEIEDDKDDGGAAELDGGGSPFERREEERMSEHVGADGLRLDDGSPAGKLDENDDALLLKITQLKYGGLPISGSGKTVSYEHVVVDEAQDLSPTDVAVLRGALTKRESMTLAGDTAQKLIFDNGFEDWETMLEDVGIEGVKIDQLRISYRSTRQIVEFSRHVLGPLADPVPPVVPRTGAEVERFTHGSTGEAIAMLGEALRSLALRERRANCAVVTRYAAQADMYYQGLKKSEVPALRRVHGKDFSFSPGIDVVDVAQVKGLEYDYVVLAEVNASSYPVAKEARHLLHIGSTRAVHQLWVMSVGEPSALLPELEL